MDVYLLGPVEARLDERPIALGAPKQRAVLAMLALAVDHIASAGAFAGGRWRRSRGGRVGRAAAVERGEDGSEVRVAAAPGARGRGRADRHARSGVRAAAPPRGGGCRAAPAPP